MDFTAKITIEGQDLDGFFIVKTKRLFHTDEKKMTYERYKEQVEHFKLYCDVKGYGLECDDIDQFISTLLSSEKQDN